jgi:glycerol-3-phosphate dehydrogenase (NAD(P)+)
VDSRSIVVFGAGSWGTALAVVLADKGHRVTLWARREEVARQLTESRENEAYLPGFRLPESLQITSDLLEAARSADVWIVAVPSQSVRAVAERLDKVAHPDLIVYSAAKGIENGTLLTTTQVLDEALTNVPIERLGVLYGPSHAEEVVDGKPTTVVSAGHDADVAREVQSLFLTDRFRVYMNPDVTGVEIGGSVKNVLAIGAGISDGLGYGDNAKAALITRGMAEIRRLGVAMGADPSTFGGLSGIGDVVVTCMSGWSRNRRVGEEIGQGKSLDEIVASMRMVAEGVQTTRSVYELSQKFGIDMPITQAVYEVLFEGKRPQEAVEELMSREAKREEWLPDMIEE